MDEEKKDEGIEQFSQRLFIFCPSDIGMDGRNPAACRRQITSTSYRGVVEPFAMVS